MSDSAPRSFKRREKARKRTLDGKVVCSCGCGREPVSPRRNWFSDECVQAWKIANDPNYVREKLQERDRGVCALCGCDSNQEYKRWREAVRECYRLTSWFTSAMRTGGHVRIKVLHAVYDKRSPFYALKMPWYWAWRRKPAPPVTPDEAGKARREFHRNLKAMQKRNMPPGNWTPGRSSGWDADHIVPVCEGGGQCGLDNYRTLCHPCHKRVTRELAARRKVHNKRP